VAEADELDVSFFVIAGVETGEPDIDEPVPVKPPPDFASHMATGHAEMRPVADHGSTIQEAVRKCREMGASIHGMVTDVVMPQMGGKDAVRQIRQLCPDLVVLFMTGYTEDFVTLNEMLDEGMAILQKPLRAEELLRQLRDSLDRVKRSPKNTT
jgi:CheY-like chemotaxis protein